MQQSITIISRLPSVWPNWLTVSRSVSCAATTKFSSTADPMRPADDKALKPKAFKEIPGPWPLPIIKNTLYFFRMRGRANLFLKWSRMPEKYGPVSKLELFRGQIMFLDDPEHIRTMYRLTENNPVRPAFFALQKIRRENPDYANKQNGGILVENGEEWSGIRSRIQGPLLKPTTVAMYLPLMNKVAQSLIDSLQISESKPISSWDLTPQIEKWAFENLALIILNQEIGCFSTTPPQETEDYFRASKRFMAAMLRVEESSGSLWQYFKTRPYKELEAAQKSLFTISNKLVSKAKSLIKQSKKSKENGNRNVPILEAFLNTEGLSEDDTNTMTNDLIFAGVDNVANTLIFILYDLARNKECQRKLQQEIDAIMAGEDQIEADHIMKMKYLYNVIRESMRLHPVSPGNSRITTRDDVIAGYLVPKNTIVFGMNRTICKNEKYFKMASEFIPERWNRDRPLGEIHPYASLPFSTKVRMCVGKRIAMQEMSVLLIKILQKYNITLDYEVVMELKSDLIIRPASTIPFKFTTRLF